MLENFLHSGFYLLIDTVVLGLVLFLAHRGLLKRLTGVWVYLLALFLIDGIGRRYVIYHYGVASNEYKYFYWLSDVALALGAFALICTFFQRACAQEVKMWHFLRLFLAFVFILVLGISAFSLSRNYDHLWSRFIYEFQQNLFFTCLVLNTLLYVMMQQAKTADDELSMLVCGLGLQFAGPAANLALVFLTPGHEYGKLLYNLVGPFCTLGMVLTWFHAVTGKPKIARVPAKMEFVPARAGHGQAA